MKTRLVALLVGFVGLLAATAHGQPQRPWDNVPAPPPAARPPAATPPAATPPAARPPAARQPAATQPSANVQRLREFIGSTEHLQAVRAALTAFEPAALAAACKDVRPTKGRAWLPLEEPVFNAGAGPPRTALWQETWEVSACGKPGLRSLGFRARPDEGIVPIPMFPGESRATLLQQLDAGQLALTDAAPAALNCEERGRIQVIGSAVTRAPGQAGGPWSERWTVAGCGRTAAVDVDFRADPQGRLVYEFRGQPRR